MRRDRHNLKDALSTLSDLHANVMKIFKDDEAGLNRSDRSA